MRASSGGGGAAVAPSSLSLCCRRKRANSEARLRSSPSVAPSSAAPVLGSRLKSSGVVGMRCSKASASAVLDGFSPRAPRSGARTSPRLFRRPHTRLTRQASTQAPNAAAINRSRQCSSRAPQHRASSLSRRLSRALCRHRSKASPICEGKGWGVGSAFMPISPCGAPAIVEAITRAKGAGSSHALLRQKRGRDRAGAHMSWKAKGMQGWE
mmetsp:Transcript_24100/g.66995  ORF Transcript_24100/g.66995 Transcript_24100/m.66995 type:complete len:211 (+) Transcript_24100:1912-2544(+)